ncbi:hypothetical protein APHCR_0420 [Anaplasma phagocytophilum str. CR1007]|nr:hypothetical protein APHCR_0417 [Anaplasma phagocytophilum str. CR1007]KJZ99192.1 hypothetical protein APHCR_0420 [Anaplasma phagocytophilum str. CR1007]
MFHRVWLQSHYSADRHYTFVAEYSSSFHTVLIPLRCIL